MAAQQQRPWLRAFCTGLQFLTRLPIPGRASSDPASFAEDSDRALIFFPMIGGFIGGTTAAIFWLCSGLWPISVAVLIALSLEALLTGALHEDAVADFCDAFGGGKTREDILRILRDSRIGSFGLVGLSLLLALRGTALVAAGDVTRTVVTLVISGAMGRLALLIMMVHVPPIPKRDGLLNDMSRRVGWSKVLRATTIILPVLALAIWTSPSASLATVVLLSGFILWFGRLLRRRLGGSTGDCVGMAGYVIIVVTTLMFSTQR